MNHSGDVFPHSCFIIFTTEQIKALFVSVDYIQIGPSIYSMCKYVMKTESEKIERRDFMVNHTHTHTNTNHTVNLIWPCVEGGFWGSLSSALKQKKKRWWRNEERKNWKIMRRGHVRVWGCSLFWFDNTRHKYRQLNPHIHMFMPFCHLICSIKHWLSVEVESECVFDCACL